MLIQAPDTGEIPPKGSAALPGGRRGAFFNAGAFDVVDQDPIHDLALLKLKNNPFTVDLAFIDKRFQVASAKFSLGRPDEGEPIAVSGYPLSSSTLITTSGAVASSWSVDPGPAGWESQWSDIYLADMRVNPGNSGGPVFSTQDGSVIGVCVRFDADLVGYAGTNELAKLNDHYLSYNSGLSLVVPAKYVVELLKKNHLKWTATDASP